jgi:carbon-monoxide dehydrogenase medium subunit
MRASEAEFFLIGKLVTPELVRQAAELATESVHPIDDIRASMSYRKKMVFVLVRRALEQTLMSIGAPLKIEDVVLWGNNTSCFTPIEGNGISLNQESVISLNINNQDNDIKGGFHKSLLDLLRENALLTGTKEGCGEGECGACTVFMDGVAVMACLVPAPRSAGCKIVTVEGIATPESLHKIQQAFIDEGAVQCGYCTPGFVMSAVKLLEEKSRPSVNEIKIGLSGNLCRCTGYYKIIKAVEKASEG